MKPTCTSCGKDLPEGARFCPWCGEPQPARVQTCALCGFANPADAVFCGQCGIELGKATAPPRPESPYTEPQAIADRFFQLLYDTLQEQQDPALFEAYMNRLQESEFRTVFEARMQQLSSQVQHLLERAIEPEPAIETLLDQALDELIDFFMVRHTADLNVHPLPQGILKYGYADLAQADLFGMIMDYLDWPSLPEELVYTNLLELPEKLLHNAAASFLFVERNERVFFIHDWTLLHTLKAGFAMTDLALYWKAPSLEPQKVYYHHLRHVAIEGKHLEINGKYFYAHPTLHVRLARLLRKIMARQRMLENE